MRLFTKAVEAVEVELSVVVLVPTLHAGKVVAVIELLAGVMVCVVKDCAVLVVRCVAVEILLFT